MKKPFFDRRVEKRSLSGAKTRLFKEVHRKMTKSDGQFIFFSFLNKMAKDGILKKEKLGIGNYYINKKLFAVLTEGKS